MEGDEEDTLSSPFWAEPSAHHPPRLISLFYFSATFLVVFTVCSLAFFNFVVPSVTSFASTIFRPQCVKKKWELLNLILILFAVLCALFGHLGVRNTDDADPGKDNRKTKKPTVKEADPEGISSSTSLPSRFSSLLIVSGAFLVVLTACVVIFVYFVVPPIVAFASTIYKIYSLMKEWESLKLVLVISAFIIGYVSAKKKPKIPTPPPPPTAAWIAGWKCSNCGDFVSVNSVNGPSSASPEQIHRKTEKEDAAASAEVSKPDNSAQKNPVPAIDLKTTDVAGTSGTVTENESSDSAYDKPPPLPPFEIKPWKFPPYYDDFVRVNSISSSGSSSTELGIGGEYSMGGGAVMLSDSAGMSPGRASSSSSDVNSKASKFILKVRARRKLDKERSSRRERTNSKLGRKMEMGR